MFAFAFYKNMDSILWSSGLFEADGNQWRETSSAFLSDSINVKMCTLYPNETSAIVVIVYCGTHNTIRFDQTAFRIPFKAVRNTSSAIFLPLKFASSYSVSAVYMIPSYNSITFSTNDISNFIIFIHVFDPL